MKGEVKGEFPWQVGNALVRIAVRFTTSGAGVATLANDYEGKVTIARSTNQYTIVVPPWVITNGVLENQAQGTAVARTLTLTPSTGTIVVAFGAAFNSGDYTIVIEASMDPNG